MSLKRYTSLYVWRLGIAKLNELLLLHNERFIFELGCRLLTTICVIFDFAIWRLCGSASVGRVVNGTEYFLIYIQSNSNLLSPSECINSADFVTLCEEVYSVCVCVVCTWTFGNMGSIFTPVNLLMVLSQCRLTLGPSLPDRKSTAYM